MTNDAESNGKNNTQIAIWLLVCCALIFSMVVLGGVTRLTHSGLSMVEWDPIMGVVPPLNHTQWTKTFQKYKRFPEYKKINRGMSLSKFKSIYWFEYSHRMLGRVIGLVFLLPFLYFLIRGKLTRPLTLKLIIMFILGGLQGVLGWYMVKSGLVDKPHVSQYRLTAHLGAAILIYGYMLWVAFGLLMENTQKEWAGNVKKLRIASLLITVLVCIMILSGGLVAGTKAGFIFNTFPKMNGAWLPPGLLSMQPVYMNALENVAAIQFSHRLLALTLTTITLLFWLSSLGVGLLKSSKIGLHLLLIMLAAQVALGISTLIYHVPAPLAATHQAGALLLFTISLFISHRFWKT